MISSRQPITSLNGILPYFLCPITRFFALFNQTSVPCDNPDIFTYDPESNGAFDYARIVNEVIEMESKFAK